MHLKLLLVTLLSSSLLCGMDAGNGPQRHICPNELTNLMPPAQLRMTDYEDLAGRDCSWFNSKQTMDAYKAQFASNPLYQTISQNPAGHIELLNNMIAEADSRCYGHMLPCCLAAIKPCKTNISSLFFFMRAYNAQQRGDACCLDCGIGCILVLASCGQCSKSARTTRGISKTIEKTLAARTIFSTLRDQKNLTAEEITKKIQ